MSKFVAWFCLVAAIMCGVSMGLSAIDNDLAGMAFFLVLLMANSMWVVINLGD